MGLSTTFYYYIFYAKLHLKFYKDKILLYYILKKTTL